MRQRFFIAGSAGPCRFAVTLAVMAVWALTAPCASGDGIEFFENKIRPIFVEHCYQCHSQDAEKLKGDLRLDSRAGLLQGGDNGPAIVPGDPERSLLIKAVRYTDADLKMPPKNRKLSAQQIADLESWVKMGAPDPREGKARSPVRQLATRQHWAFQPVGQPRVAAVKNPSWIKTPVDAFILAKLEANQLKPAPAADKRTLLRRATYDLTGLPPTFGEVEAFVKDKSPDAFARVVDRLLASPRYGERWGRHWLDVARYADTKGYVYGDREEKRFVHSYAYRDWVVRAFNDDLPYDQFLKLQIAADQMVGADRDTLAAMGFLTLGRRFLGVVHDIIDDRIDVLMRGTQGLTVGCARCHDHKFDPIPTKDYYSLYGVFAASTERTVALNAPIQNAKDFLEFDKELKRREEAFRSAFNEKRAEQSKRFRARVADYLVEVLDVQKLPTEEFYAFVFANEINPVVVRQWHTYLLGTARKFDPIWAPWQAYTQLPANEFATRAAAVISSFTNAAQGLNPLVAAAFKEKPPASMREVAQRYGKLLSEIDKKWSEATDKKSALNQDEEALKQILYADDSPSIVPAGAIVDLEWYFDEPTRVELGRLSKEIDRWLVESPGAPPQAVILEDRAVQKNPHVFKRGNPASTGEEVPRQFLEVLSGTDRKPFAQGSGRLDLANAIASTNNPLTARVMVNRIWQHHFGVGLVRTPSDFGTRSDPPSHPELLDWLARDFMDHGWSMKKLHRLTLLSAVYQQSSEAGTADGQISAQADPENKLLGHFNRQRLDFESLRDSLLFVSGELDLILGGRAKEMFEPPFSKRRAIYGYLDRQFLPGTLRVFDFANPDMHNPQRSETTVPQQALFFMNGPFVVERAKALAAHPVVAAGKSPDQKINELYRLIYQREPTRTQLRLGAQFVRAAETPPVVETAVKPSVRDWKYGHGEFDADGKEGERVYGVAPLHRRSLAGRYRPGPIRSLGWLQLTATGGHAGNDLKHAVIRRWISPVAGAVSITGTIKHERAEGHGIRAYLFSSRHGLLGNWVLHNQSAETKAENLAVEPGDTIDFIVSIHESLNNNDFNWSPMIRLAEPNAIHDANGYAREWDAKKGFQRPADGTRSPADGLGEIRPGVVVIE